MTFERMSLLSLLVALVVVMTATGFRITPKSSYCRANRLATLEMNMFERFVRVVSSNVNNVLSNLEDPEKVLDQAVNDMQNDLVKIRQSYAEISATQKRMQKQKEAAEKLANDWYSRAQLALAKGDEELAREALSRKQTQAATAAEIEKQMSVQQTAIDKLYNSMIALEQKIIEAKRQKDSFIARAKTAKTSVQVNDMLSSMTGTNSMEVFERMKAKVETLEAKAEVAGELAASTSGTSVSLEERFKELEGNSAVDDELEQLRRQLPGSQKPIPQLPQPMSAIDEEYERLKKELGKR